MTVTHYIKTKYISWFLIFHFQIYRHAYYLLIQRYVGDKITTGYIWNITQSYLHFELVRIEAEYLPTTVVFLMLFLQTVL